MSSILVAFSFLVGGAALVAVFLLHQQIQEKMQIPIVFGPLMAGIALVEGVALYEKISASPWLLRVSITSSLALIFIIGIIMYGLGKNRRPCQVKETLLTPKKKWSLWLIIILFDAIISVGFFKTPDYLWWVLVFSTVATFSAFSLIIGKNET